MRINTVLVCLVLFVSSQTLMSAATANESDSQTQDPASWLATMSEAMQSLTYEGTFVHIYNGQTDVISILHMYDQSGEHEYMSSLNGEAREIYRNDAHVVCIWPNSNDVIVSRAKPRTPLKPINALLTDSSMYNIVAGGSDRVAGVNTDILYVEPVDSFRYGYRFWVDQDTGMLLRSLVLDPNGRAVEEMIFTDIQYSDSIDIDRFIPPSKGESLEYKDPAFSATNTPSSTTNKVSFRSLPSGFTERSESYRMVAVQDEDPVTHVVVSDGIATVSVYIEYIARTEHDASTLGPTSMGAMNAYGYSLPDALVTAVGEVPEQTVEVIARAVRLEAN